MHRLIPFQLALTLVMVTVGSPGTLADESVGRVRRPNLVP